MKKLLLIGAAVLVASAGFVMNAAAQDDVAAPGEDFFNMPPEPEGAYQDVPTPDDRPFGFVQQFKEELGLTAEQEAKLEALRFEHMKARIEIGAKMKVAGIELATLMNKYGNDQAVLQKSSELTALRNQISEMMIKHRLECRAVFTAEQWDKISLIQRLGRGMRGGHGRGMQPGPGMQQRGFSDDSMRFHRNRF